MEQIYICILPCWRMVSWKIIIIPYDAAELWSRFDFWFLQNSFLFLQFIMLAQNADVKTTVFNATAKTEVLCCVWPYVLSSLRFPQSNICREHYQIDGQWTLVNNRLSKLGTNCRNYTLWPSVLWCVAPLGLPISHHLRY